MRKSVQRFANSMSSRNGGDSSTPATPVMSVAGGSDTVIGSGISGGAGSGSSNAGKLVLPEDGFERLHLARLKRVQGDLKERLAVIQRHCDNLDQALNHLDFGGSIDEILEAQPATPPPIRGGGRAPRGPGPFSIPRGAGPFAQMRSRDTGRPSETDRGGDQKDSQGLIRELPSVTPHGGAASSSPSPLGRALDEALPEHATANRRPSSERIK